jgi:hypothetical protein
MLCNAICLNYEDFNGCFTHYVMNCLLLHIMKCEVNYVVRKCKTNIINIYYYVSNYLSVGLPFSHMFIEIPL